MKKSFVFVLLLMVSTVTVLWKVEENNKKRITVPIPTIDTYTNDVMIVSEENIVTWIKNAGLSEEELVVNLKEGEVKIELVVVESLINKLNLNEPLKSAARLFEGEKITCKIQLQNQQLSVNDCNVGGLEIPVSLYRGSLDKLNEMLPDLMSDYGIDEVTVFDEKIEIQGDISEALKQWVGN